MNKNQKKEKFFRIGKNGFFTFDAYAPLTPVQLFSRDLCSLNCVEKKIPLIEDLMQKTRLCSTAELNNLTENFEVSVVGKTCHLWRIDNGFRDKVEILNLGTAETLAFLFGNFIFALQKSSGLFLVVAPRLVIMNGKRAFLLAADDLLIGYTLKGGFEMLGNFESLTKTANGYRLTLRTDAAKVRSYKFSKPF